MFLLSHISDSQRCLFHGYKFTLLTNTVSTFQQSSALFNRELIYLPIQNKGISLSLFFLLFEPSYSALETRELLGQEMESELQINQSCLMSSCCNTQTDVTGDWRMPHLHVQLLTGSAGISFCSYFVVTFNSDWYHLLTASFCSLQCSVKEGNLFLKLQSHQEIGGFGFLSQTPMKLGSREKKSWHVKSKFCPNSAVFAETILIWHISSSFKGIQELVRVHTPQEVINALLALSEEWTLAHPIWANQEQKTTHMKPPDILLDKSSLQKTPHSDEGCEEKRKT